MIGADILAILGERGVRTWVIARELGVTSRAGKAVLRRRLARLEALGVVRRSARYSAVNDIYWEPVKAEVTD